MRNQVGWAGLFLGDELRKYVDIYYMQKDSDWNINPGYNTVTLKRYEAKQCEAQDFGTTKHEQSLFYAWAGFSLICADLPKDESFYMIGDVS
jgi:hypothetical protein